MKILHLETGRRLYGGARQVLHLLDGLRREPGVESVLVCPRGSATARAAAGAGHRVIAVPMGGDADILFPFRLARIIHAERPDLVHLHSRRGADWWGGLASRWTRTPCLLTRRVDNPEPHLLAAAKYRLYGRVIAISDGIRRVLIEEGVPREKVVTVRSAVDPAPWEKPREREWFLREFGLPADALACGVIAQLIPRKGHRVLLAAAPAILAAVPAARFMFLGRGPMEVALRDAARRRGLADRVVFAGFRDDLPDILGNLALIIHPALMEGLGVSLLQAAAAGVPIVAAHAGGIPEAVRDGVNGILAPPGDAHALARAVTALLLDPARSRALGEAGRALVKREFTVAVMVEGNLAVYRRMLADPPHTGSGVGQVAQPAG
jgi:glycosyltransferase involved in cell wall biosynthesis